MTRVPLTATPDAAPEEVEALLQAANIHHLPLVDGDQVIGLWLATDEGPTVLLSADSVGRVDVSDPAEDAVGQLLEDREMVIAWEGSSPVGVLTRTDLKRVMSAGMAEGHDRSRRPSPLIIRFLGAAGCGKTTLILRTIPRLRRWSSGVVEACPPTDEDAPRRQLEGQPAVFDERAHDESVLPRVIHGLGPVEVVLFEDRERPERRGEEDDEGFCVLVVTAEDTGGLHADDLTDARAIVITKLDVAPEGFDLEEERRTIAALNPGVAVFGVAAAVDGRGLDEWQAWLEHECLPKLHGD
jgi:Ni2+-binding GTPase involved in maturation of urease and hydrogenase